MPHQYYQQRIADIQEAKRRLIARKKLLGLLRLGNILLAITAFYFLWNIGWWAALGAAIALLLVFSRLIYIQLANMEAIEEKNRLLKIAEDEIMALSGQFSQFNDGAIYAPKDHPYCNDLDILGEASLFQFSNRTISDSGAKKLADWLLTAADKDSIIQRQASVIELAGNPAFMQQLRCHALKEPLRKDTVANIAEWLREDATFIHFKPWGWLRFLLPAIACIVSLLVILKFLPIGILYATLFIMGVVAFQINKQLAPLHNRVSKTSEEISSVYSTIRCIEKESFHSLLMIRLQEKLKGHTKISASESILTLTKILERLDVRYNMVASFVLNIFFQWNLQQVLQLEKWKLQNKNAVLTWIDVMADFEALISLGTLRFNYPTWAIPDVSKAYFFLRAEALGHPLIKESKRVNNPIDIEHRQTIMLVTGSNMAGKSTYLRSVGINLVLAMAGAPVCARSFSTSPVQLFSSMRVTDNLQESTSTFYAELKKLKTIIENVNKQANLFVLLDEILRGTNSTDRHTGSVALIKQLIRKHAPAIIATHDLELANLKNEFPAEICNFHFDVQVQGDELFFDYALKEGICRSLNASLLMKKIGIEGI